jgi:MFS family permease
MQAGAVIGIMVESYIMDRWGRKAGVISCAIMSIIGGTILLASQNVTMFIVARFIAGWGSWGFLAVSKYKVFRAQRTTLADSG